MRFVLAGVLVAGLAATSSQARVIEDFEGLPSTGDLNGSAVLDGLMSVSSPTNVLRVYDTSGTGGADGDLEYADSGQALILQRPRRNAATDRPNDDANGGTVRFDVTAGVLDVISLTLFDFERNERASFTSDKGEIGTIVGTALERSGANQNASSTFVVDFASLANPENALGISWLRINTDASTAFDNLVATPIPGAALLLASGIAALGVARRRRLAS